MTNLENGDSVVVRVNDRGPYHPGRIIDLSDKAAEMLEVQNKGTVKVRVQYVGRARMDGKDMPFLMASFAHKGDRLKRFNPGGEIATGVMVASNEKRVTIPQGHALRRWRRLQRDRDRTGGQSTKSAVVASFDVMEQYAELPEFGPVPRERPMNYEPNNGALSAYAETPSRLRPSPFDKVLTAKGKLDAESIRASGQAPHEHDVLSLRAL